ncbi:MAG: hypothetical protein J7K61_01290 [Thermoplasmata archaeon]|nr:hypothetical protein [Thermoplasmata archaeon]
MKKKIFSMLVLFLLFGSTINAEGIFNHKTEYRRISIEIYNGSHEKYSVNISEKDMEKLREDFLEMAKKISNMEKSSAARYLKNEILRISEKYHIPSLKARFPSSLMPYLVVGDTTTTLSTGFVWTTSCAVMYGIDITMAMIYKFLHSHGVYYFSHLLYLFILLYSGISLMYYMGMAIPSYFNPLPLLGTIFIGATIYPFFSPPYDVPGEGWIYTISLNGVKKYEGKMYGNEYFIDAPLIFIFGDFYPAILGFSGISISISREDGELEHLCAGFALNVNITDKAPV